MPGGDTPSASAVIRLTIPKTFGGDTAHLKLVEVGRKVPAKHCIVLWLMVRFGCVRYFASHDLREPHIIFELSTYKTSTTLRHCQSWDPSALFPGSTGVSTNFHWKNSILIKCRDAISPRQVWNPIPLPRLSKCHATPAYLPKGSSPEWSGFQSGFRLHVT